MATKRTSTVGVKATTGSKRRSSTNGATKIKRQTGGNGSPSSAASIYARVGGEGAIEAAVEEFYVRVLGDRQLRGFFRDVDMERLKAQQRAFFTQALGGPANYRGPSMKRAHADLPIEKKHFERVAGHLADTLAALDVGRSLIDEVVATVAPLADEIVHTAAKAASRPGTRGSTQSKNSKQGRKTTMQRNRSRGGRSAIAEPPTTSVEDEVEAADTLEAQRTQAMVENMPTAVILAGTDLVIT